MLKILLYFFAYFFISNSCYAAPCYGTKMPEKNQLFGGIQTYSVLKRYLKNQNGEMRSLQNFVLISYGIYDWLCLDLKGGAGYIRQQPCGAERIDYATYLGGGYGFRMGLYDSEKTKIVFGFQHISVHPHKVHKNGIKRKSVLDDWQFSLLASRDFSKLSPYLGTRCSSMDYILWVNGERNRIKSDRTKNVGLIVGVDITLNEKAWFNVEGSFFDAEAFATSLNFRF